MNFFHSNDVVLVVGVVLTKVGKDFNFDLCLVFKLFAVFNDFDSNDFFLFVVIGLDTLAERPTAEPVHDLVSISNVVVEDDLVIAVLIVVAIIEFL